MIRYFAALAVLVAPTPTLAAPDSAPAEPPAAAATPPPAAANPESRPPPTPEEIDRARAEADKFMKEAGVTDIFTNITDSRLPIVRHNGSGLHCGAGSNTRGIQIYDGSPRGDDVSCETTVLTTIYTLYATRYPSDIDTRAAITQAVAAIKHRFPDLRWYEGTSVSISVERGDAPPVPQTMLAHYTVKISGKDHYTQVRVTQLNGWTYMMRMTVPLEDVTTGQLLAELTWYQQLEALVDGDNPATASPPPATPGS